MFQILEEQKDFVTVKMDISTYQSLQEEIEEDISQYEFVFDRPVLASTLLKK